MRAGGQSSSSSSDLPTDSVQLRDTDGAEISIQISALVVIWTLIVSPAR